MIMVGITSSIKILLGLDVHTPNTSTRGVQSVATDLLSIYLKTCFFNTITTFQYSSFFNGFLNILTKRLVQEGKVTVYRHRETQETKQKLYQVPHWRERNHKVNITCWKSHTSGIGTKYICPGSGP
jgi:hypothetical protein